MNVSLLTLLAPRLPFDCVTKPLARLCCSRFRGKCSGRRDHQVARLAGETRTAAMTDKRMRRVAFKFTLNAIE